MNTLTIHIMYKMYETQIVEKIAESQFSRSLLCRTAERPDNVKIRATR